MSLCQLARLLKLRPVLQSLATVLLLTGLLVAGGFASPVSAGESPRERLSLDASWKFHLGDIPRESFPGGQGVALYGADITHSDGKAGHAWGAAARGYNDRNWRTVNLPHDWAVEQPFDSKELKQQGYRPRGIGWYRRTFKLDPADRGKNLELQFDGVATYCTVYFNGTPVAHNFCGYTSFYIDVTAMARYGNDVNTIAVRVDAEAMEGWWYEGAGIYRHTWLVKRSPVHVITDGVYANPVRGADGKWTIPAEVTLGNTGHGATSASVEIVVFDSTGKKIASGKSKPVNIVPMDQAVAKLSIPVTSPQLWSVEQPNLYEVRTTVLSDNQPVDIVSTKCGFRTIRFDKDKGFFLNDQPLKLQGTCNHQDHAGIGVAVPDSIWEFRIRKLKEMGSNAYRTAHNPPSKELLEICDRLGMLVMDETRLFNSAPEYLKQLEWLVRRDRNHPSVILWEVSLNESDMPKPFIAMTHAIAHEEFPGDQMFTCGWTKGYDVFIQARQHGGCTKVKDVPCVVSEYGDWEYFAQNAGLEQGKWKDLKPAERNSRQLRGDGEVRLLQQALNFQEAHNDNLKTRAFGDGIWVMFDYNRGYAPDIEASGVMDIFRLPKFGYWFFRSQRDPNELVAGQPVGPIVFIANHWTPDSPREVRVFSNCDEVALTLNGKLLERRRPDVSRLTTHLKHAPFTFTVSDFAAGELKASGYVNGQEAASHERRTPDRITALQLSLDLGGRALGAEGKDAVFCRADLVDSHGTIVPAGKFPVFFSIDGSGQLIGQNPIAAEAGTATVLMEASSPSPTATVFALSLIPDGEQVRLVSAAATFAGQAVTDYSIRYTTDGTVPTADSPEYRHALQNNPQLRVAVVVKGKVVAGVKASPFASMSPNPALRRAALNAASN